MIIDLLMGLWKRYAGPLVLAGIVAAVLAGTVYGLATAAKRVYKEGYDAATAEWKLKLEKAEREAEVVRADQAARLDMAEGELKSQAQAAARRIAAAREKARTAEAKLNEALQANPVFAAIERPADLRGMRVADFTELSEAAARGAALSTASLPGVPPTNGGEGTDPRRGREGGPGEPRPVGGLHQPTQ